MPVGGGLITPARYTINGTVLLDHTPEENIRQLSTSSGGPVPVLAGATFYLYVGAYDVPAITLTQSDLRGPVKVQARRARKDLFNAVKGTYTDGPTGQPVDYPQIVNALYQAQDGQQIVKNIDFPFVTNPAVAQRLAKIALERSRQGITIEFPCKASGFRLRAWDTVMVSLAKFGFANKVFRVAAWTFNSDATVDLVLTEEAAGVYAWSNGEETTIDLAPDTTLPDPRTVSALTGLTLASGTDQLLGAADGTIITRLHASWSRAASSLQYQGGKVEVQAKRVQDTDWKPVATLDGAATEAYIVPVVEGDLMLVRVRVHSNLGAYSDWATAGPHRIVGKSEPPPAVDRFKMIEQPGGIKQFFWSMASPPVDLFAFEVRYSLGTAVRPWDQLITLFAKDRNARQNETTEPRTNDTYTFAIRAVDTSGIYSDPVYTTEVLDGDAFGAVLLIVLPYEQNWPGIKTDCVVNGSSLLDTGSLTWNDFDFAWSATDQGWGDSHASPISYEHSVIDLGAPTAVTVRASSLAAGATTTQLSTSDDGVTFSAWSDVPSAAVTARYFKFKWSVSGSAPILYRAQVVFY